MGPAAPEGPWRDPARGEAEAPSAMAGMGGRVRVWGCGRGVRAEPLPWDSADRCRPVPGRRGGSAQAAQVRRAWS